MAHAPASTSNNRALRYFVLAAGFTFVAISCESSTSYRPSSEFEGSRTPTTTSTRLPKEQRGVETPIPQTPNATKANIQEQKTPSQHAALIFLSLLSERYTDPTIDPVTKICQGPMWLKLDENFSNSMGSSDSYIATINETKFIVGGSIVGSVYLSLSSERKIKAAC